MEISINNKVMEIPVHRSRIADAKVILSDKNVIRQEEEDYVYFKLKSFMHLQNDHRQIDETSFYDALYDFSISGQNYQDKKRSLCVEWGRMCNIGVY